MPNDVYTHFFPSLPFHCLLFCSCAFSHSQFYCDSFLYHSLILRICIFWLECGSDSRGNIFLFAESSVLNLSFGWWNFRTTHTHTNTNTVCWTAIFIQSTIWNAYFVACKWTLKWWWCCCHRLSPRGSPFTQSDKECDRLNACRLSARSRVFASVCVCVCVWKYMYMCAMCARARAHPHSFHIKYASSSAVYLTSSAIKMLILHCIRLLAAYAFFYFSSRFFCMFARFLAPFFTLWLCFSALISPAAEFRINTECRCRCDAEHSSLAKAYFVQWQ